MNGAHTPAEMIAMAEACLATSREALALSKDAQTRANVWNKLAESAIDRMGATEVIPGS